MCLLRKITYGEFSEFVGEKKLRITYNNRRRKKGKYIQNHRYHIRGEKFARFPLKTYLVEGLLGSCLYKYSRILWQVFTYSPSRKNTKQNIISS